MIAEIFAEIVSLGRATAEMRACPACTLEEPSEDTLACQACGSELPPPDTHIRCPSCPAYNVADASACATCGHVFDDTAAVAAADGDASGDAPRCEICDGSEDIVVLDACEHIACRVCLCKWILECDSDRKPPACPHPGCRELGQAEVAALLSAEQYERHEWLSVERAVGGSGAFMRCGTAGCPGMRELPESAGNLAGHVSGGEVSSGSDEAPGDGEARADAPSRHWWRCEACAREWCVRCRKARHRGMSCAAAAKAAKAATPAEAEAERATAALLRRSTRRCIKCHAHIVKVPGSCDKMQCKCGYRFCFRCDAPADANGRATCKCVGADHTYWDNNKKRAAPQTSLHHDAPKRGRPNKRRRAE